MYRTFDTIQKNIGGVFACTDEHGNEIRREIPNKYVLVKSIPHPEDSDKTLSYISCPECNYVFNEEDGERYEGNYLRKLYKCPHCGHLYRIYNGSLSKKEIVDNIAYYRSKGLSNNKRAFDNFRLISSTLFEDTENGKYGVIWSCVQYFMNINAHKIVCTPFRVKLIFNPKDGMTYLVPPKDQKGKILSTWTGPKIMNITYRDYQYCSFTGLFDAVKNRVMSHLFNCDEEDPDEHAFDGADWWLPFAKAYNHCPAIKHLNFESSAYLMTILRYFPVGETDPVVAIAKFMEKAKVPCKKSIKKLCMQDPSTNLTLATFAGKCGLKDENSFLKILLMNKDHKWAVCNKLSDEKFFRFAKKFIKAKGENAFVKQIIEGKVNIMADTANMYYRIQRDAEHMLPLLDNGKPFWEKKLSIMHDELSFLVAKIKYANKEIPYTDAELAAEDVVDGFSFEYAKDTNALVECGQTLKICVAGYRDRCLNKQCNILFIKKDGEFVGCSNVGFSENKKNPFALYELKGYRNNNLHGDIAQAVRTWVSKHKVAVNTDDYAKMDTHRAEMDGDWHYLELIDGNVVEVA